MQEENKDLSVYSCAQRAGSPLYIKRDAICAYMDVHYMGR